MKLLYGVSANYCPSLYQMIYPGLFIPFLILIATFLLSCQGRSCCDVEIEANLCELALTSGYAPVWGGVLDIT